MDTRNKIVRPEALPANGRPLKAILGYFDPIYAPSIQRLLDVSDPESAVIAIVADPPSPLLPLRARAELAASLRCIDFVVEAGSGFQDVLDALPEGQVLDERDADLVRRDALVKHVIQRQQTR